MEVQIKLRDSQQTYFQRPHLHVHTCTYVRLKQYLQVYGQVHTHNNMTHCMHMYMHHAARQVSQLSLL